jgi:hypothetical protein
MTSQTAPNGVDEELAQLRRAVLALEAKIAPAAPTHPVGPDGAFKLLVLADELRQFGHQPKQPEESK